MLETFSILVHASSKVGKSTLGGTCPPPVLILDAEGSTKFLAIRKVEWKPEQGPPPAYDGTWDATIVVVRDFDSLRLVYQWLISGQHPFSSIVLDSISEIQRKLKKQIAGTEAMQIAAWGELLTRMDDLIRGFRDLTMHPTNPVRVVMFIAETRESKSGKWVPYVQGQLSISLPYLVDVCGYLYVADAMAADQVTVVQQRQLLVTPHPQYETGERVQGRLGDVVVNPNITQMLLQIYPDLNQSTTPQEATQ